MCPGHLPGRCPRGHQEGRPGWATSPISRDWGWCHGSRAAGCPSPARLPRCLSQVPPGTRGGGRDPGPVGVWDLRGQAARVNHPDTQVWDFLPSCSCVSHERGASNGKQRCHVQVPPPLSGSGCVTVPPRSRGGAPLAWSASRLTASLARAVPPPRPPHAGLRCAEDRRPAGPGVSGGVGKVMAAVGCVWG